jgi:hypothetical protein
MPLPDSSDIDNALVAKLGSDTTLLANMTHGVYMDEAVEGATRYVIVSVVEATDVYTFGRKEYEDILYLVEPRALAGSGGDVKAAAARIETLLQDQPLTVTGYTWMTTFRHGRPGEPREVRDAANPNVRWQRRGALYRVQMSL